MTPEQQKAVALARAKAKARARGTGKTYTQGESFSEGIGSGVNLGARDEAEGGQAVRRALGGGFLDDLARSVPFGEIPLRVLDAAGGFAQEFAPGKLGGQVQKIYEAPRDERRTIQQVAQIDNPLSYLGGDVLGSSVTLAPLGTLGVARSTATVGAEKTAKAADLMRKAAAATDATKKAALTAKATNLAAQGSKLAKPATTAGDMGTRIARLTGETAFRSGRAGAGFGAGLGFTNAQGELEDRFAAAGGGAVAGGIGGAIIGPLALGLAPLVGGIAYKITTPKEVKGLDMVIKRMQRSGTTPEGIRAQFDLWNKTGEVPETLAEFMGPNERSLLSALITVNRETREQATNIFVGRGKEEVNRLEDAFAGSFGAKRGDYAAAQTQAAKARVEDPEPFYKAAHFDKDGSLKPLGPEKMSVLNNILADEDDIVRIAKDATADLNRMGNKSPPHKAARDEVRLYSEALQAARRGERVQIPELSVLAADYIERAVNQSYKAAGGGSGEISGSIAGWRALRDSVRDVIDDTGIGEARATSAERIRRGELLEEGLKIMNKSVDVDDVNRIMTGIPDAGIPSASAEGRKAYGVGASRAVANELRNVPDMAGFADATRKVARTPALREKLEAARPKVLTKSGAENKGSRQTKANAALDTAIERASDRAQFGVDMVGNSKTAFRQGDVTDAVMDDAMSQQAGEVIGDLLISGVGGVTQRLQDRAGRFIGNRIGQPSIYRPQVNRAAAEVLLATGEQIPIQIARIAKRAAERANGRTGRAGLPITSPSADGTPAANALAQKPGKLGTRTADAAAIAMLTTGGPTAEADTGGTAKADTGTDAQARIAELSQSQANAQQQITEYEQGLKDFKALPVTEKQRFLKENGFLGSDGKPLVIDGRPEGNTAFAIKAYEAQTGEAIAAAKAERETFRKDINDIRVALAQKPEKQTNPLIDKLTEYGTYGAVAYLAHRGRGAMVKGSQVSANRAAAKANALLTRLPVPPEAPRKTLLSRVPIVGTKQKARIKRKTTAANKAQFATEERLAGRNIPPISSNPTSPDGLPNRLANVDEFDRQAAAGDFGPVGRIGRFMEPVNSRFRGSDLAVIGTGAADTYITEGMIQKTREDIVAEEKKLTKAIADDNPDAIGLSTKRLEQLRQAETVQVILQRIGIGMMIGGGFGLTHGRYARPQPRYEAAARERDLINRAMAPPPSAPPPAPPAPLPAPAVNTPAPAPAKPRTVGKPKPKPLTAEELRKLEAILKAVRDNKD